MAEHAQVLDVLALLRDIQQRTHTAEGCFGAQVCAVDEEPAVITVVSRWRDRDLQAFRAAESGGPIDDLRTLLAGPRSPVTTAR